MWQEHLFPIREYLIYFLLKEDRHSLQSPFAFDLYQGLKTHIRLHAGTYKDLEKRRLALFADQSVLEISDFGAGSKKLKSRKRKTSSVARHSTSKQKFALLYQYFCQKTPAETVLELGTCLGVSTAYLRPSVKGKFFTFEGAAALAQKAKSHFDLSGVAFILGDIQQTLPEYLKSKPIIDFVLMDATHTYDGTIAYFNCLLPHLHEDSILIVGDIHWSKSMKKAWGIIQAHPKVTCTFDFFECAVVFFKPGLSAQHYMLSI